MTEIDKTLEALSGLNLQSLRSEVNNLRAIKDWAMQQLGVDYEPGDRVAIVSADPSDVGSGSGWYHYREALAPGQTGTAGEIFYNASHHVWQVDVAMDRTWSVSDRGDGKQIRFWNGPASETPEGFEAPTKFDQERYTDGKVKHFYMDVTWVAKAPRDVESEAA